MHLRAGGAGARPRDAVARVAVSFTVVQSLLCLAYLLAPVLVGPHGSPVTTVQGPAFIANRLLATAVLAYGVARARTAVRRHWSLALLAVLLWDVTDVAAAVRATTGGAISGWEGSGLLTVAGYVAISVGVLGLARSEGLRRGPSVWLETAVSALSVATCWWVSAGHDLLTSPSRGVGALLANLYPLGDVLVAGAAVVMLSSRTGRAWQAQALVVSCLAGVAGDVMFGAYVSGRFPAGATSAPFVWMLQFSLLALASLSARRSASDGAPGSGVTGFSIAAVTTMLLSLAGPAVTVGVLSVTRNEPPPPGELAAVLVATPVMIVLAVLRVRILVGNLERQAVQLEETSRTDELTGLPNRRAGDLALQHALAECAPGRLVVAILDLDHFKSFNDAHGHLQGDRLLRSAARAWSDALEGPGLLYRYGGEEFVVVLPHADVRRAHRVLQGMRAATPRGQSFSAGIAVLHHGDGAADLLDRADASLYAAKAAGRGVSVHDG